MLNKRCAKLNKKARISILCLAAALFLILLYPIEVFALEAGEQDAIIDEQLQADEIGQIETELKKISQSGAEEIIPDFDPEKILEDAAKGKFELNIPGIINRGLSYLFNEIYVNIHVMVKLVVLIVLCAILKNLQTSFLSESVGELAFYGCYVVVVSILIVSFNTVLNLSREIIDSMVNFMHACIPPLLTLLMSGGSITSAAVLQPLLITIVEMTAAGIKNIFIPIIFISTILSVVDNISSRIQLSRLVGFFKQLTSWAVGLLLTVFVAIVSIQGTFGATVDGVTGKTAKFMVKNFIPVVGSALSDAAEAVVGCALLIKNAVGLAMMAGVLLICIVPLLKILALILLYKLTCALAEPIAEPRITKCISDIASSFMLIFGIATAVMFMFLIMVTAVISAGNTTVMMR